MPHTDSRALRLAARLQTTDQLPLSLALAIILGVQCIVGASASISYQLADGNTGVHLQMARECRETHSSACNGPRTPRLGLFHGASWIRLIVYSLRTGTDLTLVQSVVLGLLILSAAITFVVLMRYLGLRAAALGLGLYLPLALAGGDFASLDNPNLLPLPLALYYAGILLFAERRTTVLSGLASVALAAALSADLVCLILVPFHMATVALFARKPVSAIAVSALSLALVFGFDSLDAARAIVERLFAIPFPVGMAIGVGSAILLLAVRMIRRVKVIASMPRSRRVHAVVTAALICVTLTTWLGGRLLGMHLPPEARYFAPAIFPFLFFAAESTETLSRYMLIGFAGVEIIAALLLPFSPSAILIGRAPFVVIVTLCGLAIAISKFVGRGADQDPLARTPAVGVILLCFALGVSLPAILPAAPADALGFRLADGERMVSSLYSAGYTYAQIAGSLQGPTADHVLALLAARDPKLFDEPPQLRDEDFSLLLLKEPHAAVARTRGVIAAFAVDRSRTAIVVRGERSFLDWVHADVCSAAEEPGSTNCMRLLVHQPLWHVFPYMDVGDRTTPPVPRQPFSPQRDAPEAIELGDRAPVSTSSPLTRDARGPLRVVMAIHTPGHGVPHIVRVGGVASKERWRIVRVTGVEFEGHGHGAEIRVLDRHQSSGTIELEVTGVASSPPWNWLRHVIEVTEDNAHLLQP